MSWTYNPSQMTPKDRVRLYVGDTNSADPQLQDEEIAAILLDAPNVLRAAAEAAETIAAKVAREVTRAVTGASGLSINASDRQQHYLTLAATLRRRAVRMGGSAPFAGGISQAQKDTQTGDTDRVPPAFSRQMMRVPGQVDSATEAPPDDPALTYPP